MFTYNLADSETIPKEILERAATEPVLIQPDRILLSVSAYTALIDKISALEDELWGKQVLTARAKDRLVGQEAFTKALQDLARGEA
jgi:hypothetical protein